jgi:hypothetical protein
MKKTAESHPEFVPRVSIVTSAYHTYTRLDEEVLAADAPLKLMNGKEYSERVFSNDASINNDMSFKFLNMLERRYGDVKRE